MTSYLGAAGSSGSMTTLKGRPGDYCLRTDQRGWWVLTAADSSVSSNWLPMLASVRTSTITSSAAPTPNADTDDHYTVTALAVGATIGAPTGTPANGQLITIRIKDNGGAQTLAWNAAWLAVGTTLPSTTVAGQTLYVRAVWNSTNSKWDVLSAQSG